MRGQEPGITFSYAALDLADQYEAVRSHRVDVGIVQYVGPVDVLVFEHALTMPWVVVVPARSPLADADRLSEADPAALDAFGHDMALGDFGGMYFFVCRNGPDTPYTHRYDC